ncbi:MAG: glycosylated S-layer protein, SlaA, partial [Saccharolobus sp.]
IVLWYVSPDFAAYYYYNTTGQFRTSNFTITFANITPELQMPQVFPVSKLYMPFGIIDPYYMFYNSISLGPVNGVIEFVENGHVVGNITSIKLQINGMNQTIVLSPANVSKLLITPNLGEVSECSPVFNAPQAFNITALAKLLGLPNVSALNGSTLYITYHDRISGAYVTNKTLLTVGEFYIMPPTIPGSVEWILTAKYVNATTGIPVEISYGVVQQPSATIVDLNLVNSSNINYLQVINVKIASKYATAEVMYNPSNASTIVYMNGMFVASYKGNLLPTIPETTTAGKFFGPVVNLYVAPGTLGSPNGTMYVVLGSNKVAIGTANLYTYAGYHFGPYTALPLVSNVTFTVEDPLIHTTLTGQTTLGAFNNTPIRIYPLNMPITPSSSYKVFYYYTKPLTLSPTSQYIVISATSVISYPYPFYIESVVFLGSNVTTGTPVPGTPAFQTVYSPALGPGVVLQVPVQMYQAISLSTPSSPHTVVMFAVPFAGGPAISEYPTFLVYTNVTAMSS